MNRCLSVVLAASMFAALANVAQAEQGAPNQATLRAMGLYGMTVLSDRDAMDVRGMGYHGKKSSSKVVTFGASYAKVKSHGAEAGTVDGYYAEGKHYAKGVHGSVAGKVTVEVSGGGHGGGGGGGYPTSSRNGGGGKPKVTVKATVVFAGGFAKASAY